MTHVGASPGALPASQATEGPGRGSIVFIDSGQSLGTAGSADVGLGDVDGDGDLDAFVVNGLFVLESNLVWLNDGRGGFTVSDARVGGGRGQSVDLGDVDHDGDLDAFVVGIRQSHIVLLGDGSGNFERRTLDFTLVGSRSVRLGDVDSDGDLDAFVGNGDFPRQGDRAWLGNGAGRFSRGPSILGDHSTRGVDLGDVDSDGDLDAVAANASEGNRVWLGDGSGAFADSGQSLGSGDSRDVALGDLDGDGDLDAFVANRLQGNRVWLGDGSGGFSDSGQSLGTYGSYEVDLGDVDGDGDLDAFVANAFEQGNRVWLNDGSGVFAPFGPGLGNHRSFAVSLGDVDGDGDLDAFVANHREGNRVWLNLGAPSVTQVLVGGSTWSEPFLDRLEPVGGGGARGHAVPVGSSAQRDPLPWIGADRIILRFSERVSVSSNDLVLSGVLGPDGDEATNDPYEIVSFREEAGPDGQFQAVWTLAAPLGGDHLRLTLHAAGIVGEITNEVLDGEWTDEITRHPSGDGVPGGDFEFGFAVAPADVDRDGAVTVLDIKPIRDALGAQAGAEAYDVFADLNGDGLVDDLDGALLPPVLGRAFLDAAPVLGGGVSTRTLTLSGPDDLLTTPFGTPVEGSVDIRLLTGDGLPIDLTNYSVRVGVEGPEDGAPVALVGGGPPPSVRPPCLPVCSMTRATSISCPTSTTSARSTSAWRPSAWSMERA